MNTKEHIIEIIARLMEDESVKEQLKHNDDLTQLKINSINFIRLVVELEDFFEVEFEDDALDYTKYLSLNELCNYLEKRKQAAE